MVLEHKFCIQKWKFLILCYITYYCIKDQKFRLIKLTCSPFPCLFEPNEFKFAPNETEFAPNETEFAPNETEFAPNETHYAPNEI